MKYLISLLFLVPSFAQQGELLFEGVEIDLYLSTGSNTLQFADVDGVSSEDPFGFSDPTERKHVSVRANVFQVSKETIKVVFENSLLIDLEDTVTDLSRAQILRETYFNIGEENLDNLKKLSEAREKYLLNSEGQNTLDTFLSRYQEVGVDRTLKEILQDQITPPVYAQLEALEMKASLNHFKKSKDEALKNSHIRVRGDLHSLELEEFFGRLDTSRKLEQVIPLEPQKLAKLLEVQESLEKRYQELGVWAESLKRADTNQPAVTENSENVILFAPRGVSCKVLLK